MTLSEENLSPENRRSIKELILDEQKLVTYLSLSKDLCIHVNDAKTLLRQVVDEIKENDASIRLNITYLISGLTQETRGLTTVCPESELESQRNALKSQFFQHIYSVSCDSSKVDNAAFASITKFEDIVLCAGLIKSAACTKRSLDEIGTLKSYCQKPDETVLPIKKEKEKPNQHNNIVKVHETKSEPLIKSKVTSPKKDTSSIHNGKAANKSGSKTSKGFAGFFTKSSSAPSTKPAKVIKESIKKEEIKSTEKKKKEFESKPVVLKEDMDVDVEVPVKEIKKEPASIKKNSSLCIIKKNAKVDKKRKRVLHVSDSESDNDPFSDEKVATPINPESDDEIPPTPSVKAVKITSGILNPKKRRKIVDKTYTDEEGYILTRKEEVYESCSEEDMETIETEPVQVKSDKENMGRTNKIKTEVLPKEKKGKNAKKKLSPPQKGKQANIMNFFKKI